MTAVCYFQDPDAVLVKLQARPGQALLSFQTFCQGVATMMETNLPNLPASVGHNNGERILIEVHLSPGTNLTSHLTLVLYI